MLALSADPAAFAAFSAGAQRSNVEWVVAAKQLATHAARIAVTFTHSAEGRGRPGM